MKKALLIQKNVIFALMIREIKTRFGKSRLGYVWALAEPLAHLLFISVIMGVFRHAVPGLNYPLFLISGIVPWLFFSRSFGYGSGAVAANKALCFFRYVKIMDILLARVFLEVVIMFFTLALLLFGFWLFGMTSPINNFGLFIAGVGLFFLFCLGVSVFVGILCALSPDFEKMVKMLIRPLYILSGVLFPIQSIPQPYRDYLMWNPLIHFFDLIRTGLFVPYHPLGYSWAYMFGFTAFFLSAGLGLYRAKRFELVST